MTTIQLKLEEMKNWVELTHFFACNFALLLSDSFSTQPNKRALKERALGATKSGLDELREFSLTTAVFGYKRLMALADRLSEANSVIFPVETGSGLTQDCPQSGLLAEFQTPLPVELL